MSNLFHIPPAPYSISYYFSLGEGSTLRDCIKAIKLFCEKSDISILWKKIIKGLPKIRRHADDRAPTIDEIPQLCISR